ncbi:MAG: GatB/YqeY domain-containing protein [Rhodothermales bacterium]|nr:GatB/YqeY domain-containing protein [Rhodothermales bacterium]
MSLKETLQTDLKEAMKARDSVRLKTVRSLRAAIQKREIESRTSGKELQENDLVQILQKEAKQRRESISQFEAAAREDLAATERAELAIIEQYLPEQMSEADVLEAVRGIVADVGATSMADIGKVMGPAMAKLRGKADGKRVQAIVKDLLSLASPQ